MFLLVRSTSWCSLPTWFIHWMPWFTHTKLTITGYTTQSIMFLLWAFFDSSQIKDFNYHVKRQNNN